MAVLRVRVLGVDTSLRSTGLGVVESVDGQLAALAYDRIKNARDVPHSACLKHISETVASYLQACRPDVIAIEGAFYFRNARTAMVLGEARGAVIAQCAVAGCPVYEYSPRKVKRAVVGVGTASKEQVALMVKTLLHLDVEPQEDCADALALAVCHIHQFSGISGLSNTPL